MKKNIFFKTNLWMILFWVWVVLILILTSMPSNPEIIKEEKDFIIRIDYLEHIFFFTVQSFLFFLAYPYGSVQTKKINSILWLLAGITFATITELYQVFIPGRSFNPVDLALNISGLLAGIPIGKIFLLRISQYNKDNT